MANRRKRSGHLPAKMTDDRANDGISGKRPLARQCSPCECHDTAPRSRLAPYRGVEILGPAQAKLCFAECRRAMISALLAQGFQFYTDLGGPGVVRLVTSFATEPADVDHFIAAIRAIRPGLLV